MTHSIKFYYNGMKVNGGKLLKGNWNWSVDADGKKRITFYATGYTRLPAEIKALFNVENNTDIMTDYFEEDRFRVEQDHPLFSEVAKAVIKKLDRDLERHQKWQPTYPAAKKNRDACIVGVTNEINKLVQLAA